MRNEFFTQRKSWHNTEAELSMPHVHKFEQAMSTDAENDDVYYYGKCACGATEI